MARIVHLLSGLSVGGKERAALRLAERAQRENNETKLILFDTPFRSNDLDLEPGAVPISFLPRRGGLDIAFTWQLAKVLQDGRTDVIHAHNDTALVYASLASLLCVYRRPRLVATFHTWPSHGGRSARFLTRAAAMNANVVAVSGDLARRLCRQGWLSRCGTIWNGVDTNVFTPWGPDGGWRRSLDVEPEDVVVGLIARFDPVKRHEDLLAAAALLFHHKPRIVFALVGQGPLLQTVKGRAREMPHVRFIANVQDVPSLLRSLDCLVLCSAQEAAPLAILEAMACGVPVVATAVGGVPHILGIERRREMAGLLVAPFDPRRLADAIHILACHQTERARLGAAGRKQALKFSFENEWRSYCRLYDGGKSN